MKAILELGGIVLFRFTLLPRLWAILLIAVNAASLLFIQTVYGQAAIASVSIGVVIMAVIYTKRGFVRLLGIGHIFWIPMITWILFHLPSRSESPLLFTWVVCLVAVNCISLVIDAVDVTRFLRGERQPHYVWKKSS